MKQKDVKNKKMKKRKEQLIGGSNIIKKQILIVEDEMIVARDIKNTLENSGYIVPGTVSSGEKAIKKTEEYRPDLVLMDIMLQGKINGIEAANIINSRYNIPIVFLTSYLRVKELEQIKKKGVFSYLLKPFEKKELLTAIESVLDKQAKRSKKKLTQNFEKLQIELEATINALSSAIEMRDPYTIGHQERVACLTCTIAKNIGFSNEQINGIRMAAIMHDIGKIHVPAEILSKPDRLTDTEFDMVKSHPGTGYDILKTIEFPWPIADIICQHHERLDGSGYPFGLNNANILAESKILAVADVVEAMCSPRSYRPPHCIETALKEISKNKGILYEPKVVDTCLQLFEGGFNFEQSLKFITNNKEK